MKFFTVIFAAGILLSGAVLAHETMGHWAQFGIIDYLYGIRTDSDSNDKVNCCAFNDGQEGARGDCKIYPDKNVRFVDGGYLLADGEFIPHSRTNVSPPDPVTGEWYFYRCQHDKNSGYGENPRTHCWFAPPTGS
jgi:hypothetical protein